MAEDSFTTDRPLKEEEIHDFFEMLNLGTPADREKFGRLERLSKESDLEEDRANEAFRVCFWRFHSLYLEVESEANAELERPSGGG